MGGKTGQFGGLLREKSTEIFCFSAQDSLNALCYIYTRGSKTKFQRTKSVITGTIRFWGGGTRQKTVHGVGLANNRGATGSVPERRISSSCIHRFRSPLCPPVYIQFSVVCPFVYIEHAFVAASRLFFDLAATNRSQCRACPKQFPFPRLM